MPGGNEKLMRTEERTTAIVAIATLIICGVLATPVAAQNPEQERAAGLRVQLTEILAKQAELQNRLRQLDEDIKPENIEKSLAGIGSTRPEDLREHRRRQFEIARKSLQIQLDELAASRTRLEAAIVQADTDAYHQSAGINTSSTTRRIVEPQQPVIARPARQIKKSKARPRRIRRGS